MPLALSVQLGNLEFQTGVLASPVAPVLAYSGSAPYTFSIAPSLPSGLSFDTATGVISGTPATTLSTTSFEITVTDSVASTDSRTVNIWVYSTYPITTVTPSTTSTNEGSTVNFTVSVVGISDGTTLYWNTTGSVFASDFVDGLTVGSFVVASGGGTISRTLKNDLDTDGTDFFRIELLSGGPTGLLLATSPIVYVNDTSISGPIKTGTIRQDPNGGLVYRVGGSWYRSTGTLISLS